MAAGIHRSGRFAYAAVNGGLAEDGHLSSFAFDAETARMTDEAENTESIHPRDLALDPTGQFLFSADEGTGSLSSFVINPQTGRLQHSGTVLSGLAPRALAMTMTLKVEVEP
jgi:6-phosphogluconolactonase (cycloisomerase 2 family)